MHVIQQFSGGEESHKQGGGDKQWLFEIYQLQYSLSAGESGGVQEPHCLAYLYRCVRWLRSQSEVMSVTLLSDGDGAAANRLPESRQQAVQVLLAFNRRGEQRGELACIRAGKLVSTPPWSLGR